MSTEYTMEQIRKMTQEEVNSKLKTVYLNQNTWRENARRALATRETTAGGNRFEVFLRNYNAKYIRTGSSAPIAHMMLIVGIGGYGVEYLAHHRHTRAAKSSEH